MSNNSIFLAVYVENVLLYIEVMLTVMSLYTTINSISNMVPMIVHAYPYAILVRTNLLYQRGNQKSLNRRIYNTMAK